MLASAGLALTAGSYLTVSATGTTNYNGCTGTAPPALNFSTLAALGQATISPQLRQVFFIGDGSTGTGSGSAQRFVIPAGATRLYLGPADSFGRSANNTGSFTVTVSDAAPTQTPVPLPGSAGLAVLCLLVIAAA